jgi:hypothetical protein
MTKELARLRELLGARLQSPDQIQEAGRICQAFASAGSFGSALLLLFAQWLWRLLDAREGGPVVVERYEALMSGMLPLMVAGLDAIENQSVPELNSATAAFASAVANSGNLDLGPVE